MSDPDLKELQSEREANTIALYWLEHYCPTGLKNKQGKMDPASGDLLVSWCLENYGKVCFYGLTRGVDVLTDQLNWYNTIVREVVKVEKPKSAAEVRQEELRRMADAGVNIQPRTTELDRGNREEQESNRRREAKEAKGKEQNEAKNKVESLINNYKILTPNGKINHSVTNPRVEQLRAALTAAKGDFVKALAEVERMIEKFDRQDQQRG